MIKNEDIRQITDRCKADGHDVKVGDIAYLILCKHIADKDTAYKAIFGIPSNALDEERYINSKKITYLQKIIDTYIKSTSLTSSIKKTENITFEENKEALINLLAEIKEAKNDGTIDAKDAYKMETDIRIKLNDKFNVADDSEQRYVIVEPKFNTICEHTRKECWLQTKDYAKQHWQLYEKEELMEELMKKYELIEK